MSNSTTHSDNQVIKFNRDVTREYIRNNRFSKAMGADANAIIRVREEKETIIRFPLIQRAVGNGVKDNERLKGNGEAMRNFSWEVRPRYIRHAHEFTKDELDKPNFDFLKEAKPSLSNWSKDQIRDDVIDAFMGFWDGSNYRTYTASRFYSAASEAEKDTWLNNNSDRVLFGAALSNHSSLDHSTSLANLDNTADKLTKTIVSLAKRIARTAGTGSYSTQRPRITPYRTEGDDKEWFLLYCNSLQFRDFKASLATDLQQAMPRDKSNPLWTDGDLIFDGVIVKEIPEIPVISGVGAGSIDVAAAFLCGTEALSMGLAQRPTAKTDNDDYDFQKGVGIEFKHDIRKTFNNLQQNGMVTIYCSAVADA